MLENAGRYFCGCKNWWKLEEKCDYFEWLDKFFCPRARDFAYEMVQENMCLLQRLQELQSQNNQMQDMVHPEVASAETSDGGSRIQYPRDVAGSRVGDPSEDVHHVHKGGVDPMLLLVVICFLVL